MLNINIIVDRIKEIIIDGSNLTKVETVVLLIGMILLYHILLGEYFKRIR